MHVCARGCQAIAMENKTMCARLGLLLCWVLSYCGIGACTVPCMFVPVALSGIVDVTHDGELLHLCDILCVL